MSTYSAPATTPPAPVTTFASAAADSSSTLSSSVSALPSSVSATKTVDGWDVAGLDALGMTSAGVVRDAPRPATTAQSGFRNTGPGAVPVPSSWATATLASTLPSASAPAANPTNSTQPPAEPPTDFANPWVGSPSAATPPSTPVPTTSVPSVSKPARWGDEVPSSESRAVEVQPQPKSNTPTPQPPAPANRSAARQHERSTDRSSGRNITRAPGVSQQRNARQSRVYGVTTNVLRKKKIDQIQVNAAERAALDAIFAVRGIQDEVFFEAVNAARSGFLLHLSVGDVLLYANILDNTLTPVSRVTKEMDHFEVVQGVHKAMYLTPREQLSYLGAAALQRAAAVLNLSDTSGIEILDQEGSLVLVHYKSEARKDVYGNVRGIVVDIADGVGVMKAASFAYTPTANVFNELTLNEHGQIALLDEDGVTHIYDQPSQEPHAGLQTHIYSQYSGRVVRAFLHAGKLILSSHRRLKAKRFTIEKKNLEDMYYAAGGPTQELLFGSSARYSSICYVFFVSAPPFLTSSRMVMDGPNNPGFVVMMYTHRMWETVPPPYAADGPVLTVPVHTFTLGAPITGIMNEPRIVSPLRFTLEAANNHLMNGYFKGNREEVTLGVAISDMPVDDQASPAPPTENSTYHYMPEERQQMGESLIIYKLDPATGKIYDLIEVVSYAERWRRTILGTNGSALNLYQRLVELSVLAYRPMKREQTVQTLTLQTVEDLQQLADNFVLLELFPVSVISELYRAYGRIDHMPHAPAPVPATYGTPEFMLRLIYQNLVLCAPRRGPVNSQAEAAGVLTTSDGVTIGPTYFDRFNTDRQRLVAWLNYLIDLLPFDQAAIKNDVTIPEATKRIIINARETAVRRVGPVDIYYRRLINPKATPVRNGRSAAAPALDPYVGAPTPTADEIAHNHAQYVYALRAHGRSRIMELIAYEDAKSLYGLISEITRGFSLTMSRAAAQGVEFTQLHPAERLSQLQAIFRDVYAEYRAFYERVAEGVKTNPDWANSPDTRATLADLQVQLVGIELEVERARGTTNLVTPSSSAVGSLADSGTLTPSSSVDLTRSGADTPMSTASGTATPSHGVSMGFRPDLADRVAERLQSERAQPRP